MWGNKNIYSGKGSSHLLGGVVSVLTGGRATRVDLSQNANTGMCEYKNETTVRRIVIPTDDKLPKNFTLDAVRGLLDHESAHAIWTDCIGFRPQTALEQIVTNILEDARIEVLMKDRFPGAADNITELNQVAVALSDPETFDRKPAIDQALHTLSVMTSGGMELADFLADKKHGKQLAQLMDKIRPIANKAIHASTTKAVYACALSIIRVLEEARNEAPMPNRSKDPEETKGTPDSKSEMDKGDSGSTEEGETGDPEETKGTPDSKSEMDKGDSGSRGEGSDDATQFLGELADAAFAGNADPNKAHSLADQAFEEVKGAIEAQVQEERLEYDRQNAKLIRTGLVKPIYPLSGMDREQVLPKGPDPLHRGMQSQVQPVVMGIRSALRMRLLSEGRTKLRMERESGALASKSIGALAAGTSHRVFGQISRGRSQRTAVTLLVDCSGSMDRFRKIETATLSAMALSEALNGLPGVEHEVLGFTTKSDSAMNYVAKPFAQKDSRGIESLLGVDRDCNADGRSVRWAARRLMSRKADRRILIVLSDGMPTVPDGEIALTDLKSAVAACERNGIETVGIGILSKAVEEFYPKHVVIQRVDELTGAVLHELAKLFDPAAVEGGKREARHFTV